MTFLSSSSSFLSFSLKADASLSHGAQYSPWAAAASINCCSRANHASSQSWLPLGPVRKNHAPALRSSSYACLPSGVLPSGGGGSVNPIGKTLLPLHMSTLFSSIVTLLGPVFSSAREGTFKAPNATNAARNLQTHKAPDR